jgi:hypothetical protein
VLGTRRSLPIAATPREVFSRLEAAAPDAGFEAAIVDEEFRALPSHESHQVFPNLRVRVTGNDAVVEAFPKPTLVLRGIAALLVLGFFAVMVGDREFEIGTSAVLLLLVGLGYMHIRGRNEAAIQFVERTLAGLGR